MARTTAKGFYVWDLTTDSFSHTQLAANWDLLDSLPSCVSKLTNTIGSSPDVAVTSLDGLLC
jgi:hypothetical protein